MHQATQNDIKKITNILNAYPIEYGANPVIDGAKKITSSRPAMDFMYTVISR